MQVKISPKRNPLQYLLLLLEQPRGIHDKVGKQLIDERGI
jgi:hypothetical protein